MTHGIIRRVHRREMAAEEHVATSSLSYIRHPRACLACKDPFDSAWAGEQICPRCKNTSAWRTGGSSAATSLGQPQSRSGRKGGS